MASVKTPSARAIAAASSSFIIKARVAATVIALLLPFSTSAQPIKLKLSYYSSDRSLSYVAAVEPFVSAVNREGKGLIEIGVYFSGTLGRSQQEQEQLVRDGRADIAFIVPGQYPARFSDNPVIELPGLFRDAREATLIYSRLIKMNALAGYDDYFVIASFATAPEFIHSHKHVASLADLKGQKLRVNNPTQAAALAKLGAIPVEIAYNETLPAISSGAIDGACASIAQLFDSGIGRLATNHYLLATSVAPLALLMNRQVFDRLPAAAKEIIRKYSGEWVAPHYADTVEKRGDEYSRQINLDPRRTLVSPSVADIKTAEAEFASIRNTWAAASPRNAELLARVEAELSKLRAEK